jgi:hypothetical protein
VTIEVFKGNARQGEGEKKGMREEEKERKRE